MAVFDIDRDDELTTVLQINKTPTVLLVNDGEVIDGMKGLASEREMNEFFGSLNSVLKLKETQAHIDRVVESIYD